MTLAPVENAARTAAEELVYGYLNRAAHLDQRGHVDRTDVDTAMRLGCRLPAGPFETLDRIGLGTAVKVLDALHERTGHVAHDPAEALRQHADEGRDHYPEASSAPRTGVGPAEARPIERVGVLGSGTMARGIAEVSAAAGIPTTLVARSAAKAIAAAEAIGGSLAKAVARGKNTEQGRAEALGRLAVADDVAALSTCDLVAEAIVEDLPAKRVAFATLGRVGRPGAVLATTTSSLSVVACAEASGRPADVLGLHFFNPAPVMRLVEVVRTQWTSGDVLAAAEALCARLGRTGVPCADTAGFIVNYLLFPYLNEAVKMLDRGEVDVAELDAAVEEEYGYPMGPFALLDAVGLDVSLAIQRRLHEEYGDPDLAPAASLERLVAAGHLGRKTGSGFRAGPT
ncbi:3-hydroxyacyl-CoA dehydrogenase NAD-binding domain-containing protein [Phytohabitans flavus]|uniref:3-hydroxyacyl-CoA dehydrogenase family protein n=1 Tax=Phytohabitans flavus TaxID=1076124 RepID=UPI003635E51D